MSSIVEYKYQSILELKHYHSVSSSAISSCNSSLSTSPPSSDESVGSHSQLVSSEEHTFMRIKEIKLIT